MAKLGNSNGAEAIRVRGLLLIPVMAAFVLAGCESKQPTGEAKKETPAAEVAKEQPSEASEATEPKMEASAAAEGAESGTLTAPASSPGQKENDEGVTHAQKGHWDVAESHFRKALEADAKLAEAQYNLGLALDKQNKHEDATVAFKKAAELAPDNTKITGSDILKKHTGT
ncbi:tetratricopeptide repeat protein [Petrachloros mirabilis]